jgi:hypothetical protein
MSLKVGKTLKIVDMYDNNFIFNRFRDKCTSFLKIWTKNTLITS